MAKLAFPQVVAPYRGFVGEVRGWMNRIATWNDRNNATASAIMRNQIQPLIVHLGGFIASVGTGLSLRTSAGAAYTPVRTVAPQADGTVRMGSTELPLISGTKVFAPATTGSYVNGYTFTIVAGAITAVVAS